jgi:hypothetical protein
MTRYTVKCQSAAGKVEFVPVTARTDEGACTAALKTLPAGYLALCPERQS